MGDATFTTIENILGIKDQNSGTEWLENKRLNAARESLHNRYRAPEAKMSVLPRLLSHHLHGAKEKQEWLEHDAKPLPTKGVGSPESTGEILFVP